MVLKLHGLIGSPFVRPVILTLGALGVKYEMIEVNTLAGEQFKPEFLKLNPLHTVPTIEDDEFALWESAAINSYLVGKFGKDDSLYPQDLQKKAIVDNRLYFNCGVLSPKLISVLISVMKGGDKKVKNENVAVLMEDASINLPVPKMTPKIHGSIFSPPVRSTLLTLSAQGVDFDFNEVNTTKGDHLTEWYLKLNPIHTIPTLEDGEFVVWDSHVINAYLTQKYGKNDSLYPKDLLKRAVVDQRMYFDCGVLFVRLRSAVLPVLKQGAKAIAKDAADSLSEGK
ncbi:hypothetical protein NQ318_004386 [Aromia moschata]|uniref:GST N-terminal domain-containing protein n=1 Tax=Aromia moschata TaxID=1265417 RepID=A0AAV8YRN8_9CUCU|nr:hypothetical protein NQ318_004386 [Aromia moschata]